MFLFGRSAPTRTRLDALAGGLALLLLSQSALGPCARPRFRPGRAPRPPRSSPAGRPTFVLRLGQSHREMGPAGRHREQAGRRRRHRPTGAAGIAGGRLRDVGDRQRHGDRHDAVQDPALRHPHRLHHVSITATFEMLLATRRDAPFKTVAEVLDYAKKNPGKLNLGAINPGSTQNLSAHLFKQMSGIDATIVTYRTTPDLITGVLRGDIDLAFDFYAALQAVMSDNKIRVVALRDDERNPLLPNVPTAKEAGCRNTS